MLGATRTKFEPSQFSPEMTKVIINWLYHTLAMFSCLLNKHSCCLLQMQGDLNLLQRGVRGEMSLTPDLHVMLETLCADEIPVAWLAETFRPCRSVRQWLSSIEEHVRYVQDCYYSRPAVLWLPAFLRPDRLFPAVVQTHAKQNFKDVANIMLTFEVIFLVKTVGLWNWTLFYASSAHNLSLKLLRDNFGTPPPPPLFYSSPSFFFPLAWFVRLHFQSVCNSSVCLLLSVLHCFFSLFFFSRLHDLWNCISSHCLFCIAFFPTCLYGSWDCISSQCAAHCAAHQFVCFCLFCIALAFFCSGTRPFVQAYKIFIASNLLFQTSNKQHMWY